jgi:hypothetical protein
MFFQSSYARVEHPIRFFMKLTLQIRQALLKKEISLCEFIKLIRRMRGMTISALGECAE